uniref:Gelsolin-like domain-containing protein n=1 Tax=Macrostomum lignano TaxID=282301 RepID=A0A1I8GEN4_9PLAT
EAAELEPAWAEVLECSEPKLFQFKVAKWESDLYGKFFDGDSYIVLNVYQEEDEDKLCYDIHFWIGVHSTADEYGTAAYKTVELDTLLDDRPVQHREVQGHESDLFKSYFPEITYMSGGCPSGFNKVHTREYTPRLFHFKGERRNIIVKEVTMSRKALDETDVYILDLGDRAYQWNSRGCNKDERFKAAQYLRKLCEERNGRLDTEVLDQDDAEEEHEFYNSLTDEELEPISDLEQASFSMAFSQPDKSVYRLSGESGSLEFSEVSRGPAASRGAVTEEDVFIIDNGHEIYVYVGENASPDEIHNALTYAHKYANELSNPLLPLTVVNSKAPARTRRAFESVFD